MRGRGRERLREGGAEREREANGGTGLGRERLREGEAEGGKA